MSQVTFCIFISIELFFKKNKVLWKESLFHVHFQVPLIIKYLILSHTESVGNFQECTKKYWFNELTEIGASKWKKKWIFQWFNCEEAQIYSTLNFFCPMVDLFLYRNLHFVFNKGCIYSLSHQQYKNSPISQHLPDFVTFFLFHTSHLKYTEMVHHCGFSHFPDG